jgi:hypothetical protein
MGKSILHTFPPIKKEAKIPKSLLSPTIAWVFVDQLLMSRQHETDGLPVANCSGNKGLPKKGNET